MNEQDTTGVHAAHCCVKHGCKYALHSADCPVMRGLVEQEYPCEFCDMDAQEEKETVDQIIAWLLGRVREIQAGTYPDETSALSMEQRAHHYNDVIRGIRERAWKV